MSGRVGDLSPLQKDKLEEFRIVVSDVLQPDHDDYFLLRWLRARNFDISKAEAMLRKSLVWRKQFGVDTTLKDFTVPEVASKYLPAEMIGCDKEGCPVNLFLYGRTDIVGIMSSMKKIESLKYFVKRFEDDIKFMKENGKKTGKVCETHIYIMDMMNFTIHYSILKQALELAGMILVTYEANYPERLKKAFIINAPSYFMPIFTMVKPFLSENTVKKISINGKDGWQEPLLEMIDAKVLPGFLGGTRTDPDGDPRCLSVINHGGPIPTSYYLKNQDSTFLEEEDVKKATVAKKSSLPILVQVDEKDSLLHWKFQTENNDIAAGVYYINGKTEEWEEVLPCQKYECHLFPETGTYLCEKAGKYVVQFDNTFSWFREKELFYKVDVIPPIES